MELKKTVKGIIKKIVPKETALYRFLAKMNRRPLTDFYDLGFHGDKYEIEFFSSAIKRSEQYIETGVSNGSTFTFIAKKFSNIPVLGCEPDRASYLFARNKTAGLSNAQLSQETSPEYFYKLTKQNPEITKKDTFFWLDSHGNGFSWPIKQEIEYITSHFEKGYIAIDDFLVPGRPWFGYDQYNGQVCSLDFIRGSLDKKHVYNIFYPKYQDQTSTFCRLRGWVLIEFGHKEPLIIPPQLSLKVEKVESID
jgi:hypothetical protein